MKTIYKLLVCLLLISCISLNFTQAQTFEADSLALVDLYNECGGENWSGFDTWLNGPLSDWEEVTVDSATQRVTHVEFSNMTLVGTLPASIGNIDKMSGKIQLINQEGLIGELPATVWKWVDVERFQLKKTGVTSVDYTGIENMVKLTEFNCENTPLSGMVPGVLFTLPSMVKLYFHDSEFDALPPEITSSKGLDRLYLNGNHLTSLPDLTTVIWKDGAKVRFHDNALTFEDLEPNVSLTEDANIEEFRYSPQASVGTSGNMFPASGEAVTLTADVGGSANVYTWIRGEDEVVGDMASFTIDAFDANTNSGKYYALVQSSIVPGLDITTGTTGLFDSPLVVDSLALVDLYNSCGGTGWGFDSWLDGPLSTWRDVTVDSATQRVTHVEFSGMTLVGELPSSLGDLDKMSGKIQMNGQEGLTGELPAAVWNWVDVERFQLKFTGITSMDLTGVENMVKLTEFNSENTPLSGMVPGEFFTLPSMVKLYFHDCEFDALPPEMESSTGLDRLYVNGNQLTSLPDMTGIVWKEGAKVRFHNNALTFEDLIPNISLTEDTNVEEFRYSPQASVGVTSNMFPMDGEQVQLVANVGGMGNTYTWVRGEDEVVGEMDTLTIDGFDANTHSGKYFAVVQNTNVPGLDIRTGTTGLFGSPLAIDSFALVDLYNECGGTGWGFDSWLNGPLSTWKDVTLDSAAQRVTHVEFSGMTLVGELPSSLGDLNKMSGKIQMNGQEGLVGELPAAVWNWVDVERFQLKFTGITSLDLTGVENMVNLTEFNSENTPLSGTVPGEFFTLPSMVKLYFHDCEFDDLPAELSSSIGLDRLYVNGNQLTSLPDLTGIEWKDGAKVRFHNNALTFEDLIPNMSLTTDTLVEEFRYSPQAKVGESSNMFPEAGSQVVLSTNVGGMGNSFTWVRGEDEVVAEMDTFTIESFDASINSGKYFAVVQNTAVPGLDIMTGTTGLYASPISIDSLALVDLYNDCGGSEWGESYTADWLQSPLSMWKGVTVDSAINRVTGMDFKDMHLIGELPSSLGDMSEMTGKVEFRDDTLLTGAVPAFLWNWTKLERFQMKFSGYTSIDTDGIDNMVNLTEFNTEGSPMTGMVPGVLFTLPSMVKLYFHDCEFDELPAELASSSGLDRLYLNGDNFADLPDMSGVMWADGAKVRVQDNFLTFEDLEYNIPLTMDTLVEEFNYSPQANVGMQMTIDLDTGDTLRINNEIGGTANIYTWIKGEDTVIDGEDGAIFQIDSVVVEDSGLYRALVQSSIVTGLDIFNEVTQVNVAPPSGIEDLPFEGLKVLGNPVGERLVISSGETIQKLTVFNVNGQLVTTSIINSKEAVVNVSNLEAGIYMIMIQNENKYQVIKAIKK